MLQTVSKCRSVFIIELLGLMKAIDTLIDNSNSFGRPISQVTVRMHHLLPLKPLRTDLTSFVKGNIYISFPLLNIRSLKIVIYQSLFI